MPREFKLPDVGEGVAEGEIVGWLVEEGDTVTEDQPVAEVETDKAVVEVPSPVNGSIQKLHYEPGDVVEVGSVIVTFAVEGEDEGAAVEPAETVEEPEPSGNGESAEAPETARRFAPPSVRRLARELGVSLGEVQGTGPSGRVTEQDVRTAAETGGETADTTPADGAEAAQETEMEMPGEPAGRDRTLATPKARGVARELEVDINQVPAVEQREGEAYVTEAAIREFASAQQSAQAADTAAIGVESGGEERIAYRGVRRTIGDRMEESKYTAPHVTHHDTVDATNLAEVRQELKGRAEEQGVKLTYMPFLMKAVVAALKEYPFLNSTLDEEAEEIVLKYDYNIGIAVATEAGLMVPVVKHVDQKGILQIAQEVTELAAQARDRSIALEDLQGSTFSITNFGAIGGEYATPIINYPEVAILGLGAIDERPMAVDGEVVARKTLPLSLSIDHRVVDGAVAAEFTNTVMEYIKNPALLLLE